MNNLIKVYDEVFAPTQCQHYINLIDKGNQFPGGVADSSISDYKPEVKVSSDVNISTDYPNEVEEIINVVMKYLDQYEEDTNLSIPLSKIEHICGRMYKENEGFYSQHIDVGNTMTAPRSISMLFYLNEIEGGELEFPYQNIKIQPKPGRLVMFPPYFMFPHIAHKSTKGNRYIMRVFGLV